MKIFIGSSNEMHPVVKEIKRELEYRITGSSVEITDWEVWFQQGRFNNKTTWEIIEIAVNSFDLAIMLFAGDDKLNNRNHKHVVTRDNVLVEAGAFAIRLGIENVFFLVDPHESYKFPSDYAGLNYISFDYTRGADNDDAYRRIQEKLNEILVKGMNGINSESESLIKNENPILIRKEKKGGKIR